MPAAKTADALWSAMQNEERTKALKKANVDQKWYTTTYADLPQDVKDALGLGA